MSSSPPPQATYPDRRITTSMPYLVVPDHPSTVTSTTCLSADSSLARGPLTSGSCEWMVVATVIEDADLMFGGKPLSTWYEEDRRQSMGSDEGEGEGENEAYARADQEARRGRQRERSRHEPSHDHHNHHRHHHHHHHHTKGGVKKGQ